MTSLPLILAPLLALQGAGQTYVAVENDTPETWTLEYPRIIQPYVSDYRRCLVGQMRVVQGKADFEAQHRTDIETCAEEFDQAQEFANRALAGRGEYADYTPADVREVFEHVGRIHIARGADLDTQFMSIQIRQQAQQDQYESEKPKGLVLELRDASVVKARTDATAAAAEAAHHQREEGTGAPN